MHENTSKLAHTSVVGEAPSTVTYVQVCLEKSVCYQSLQLIIKNFKVNVKCYTFTCEVLISSGVIIIINNNEFLNRMALQYMRTVIKGVL